MVFFRFLAAPKDKVFKVIDGEIRAYIIKNIDVFGPEGQCFYNLVAQNGYYHANLHNYPAGFSDVTEYEFNKTVFLTMEDAINELRKQRKSEDNLCDN